MDDVRKAGPCAVCLDPLPVRDVCRRLERISVPDVVGDHPAGGIHLHAVVDPVPVLGGSFGVHERLRHRSTRRSDPVRLDQVDPQSVGLHRCRLLEGKRREDVTGRQPREECQLLQAVEVIDSRSVAAVFCICPQCELGLDVFLPGLRVFRRNAKHFLVDLRVQSETGADHVGPVRLDRAGRNRCAHIEDPRPLPECPVIKINIFDRAA